MRPIHTPKPVLVLDNSVFIAALFEETHAALALTLYQLILSGEAEAIVPPIFSYEATNVILQAHRRKRIDMPARNTYLSLIYEFPLCIENEPSIEKVTQLAVRHELTSYDASYLALALFMDAPLATFDTALSKAARKENVQLVA